MIDIKLLREQPDVVRAAAKNKNSDPGKIDEALKLEDDRRYLLIQIENLRSRRNQLSRDQIPEGKKIKAQLKSLEPKLKEIEGELDLVMRQIPNIPFDSVPVGRDESQNQPIRSWGQPRQFDFPIRDHLELGEKLGIIDVATAGKVTGSRFGYFLGDLALMEIALIQLAFKTLTDPQILSKIARKYNPKPFIPVIPPVMINPQTYIRMARLDPGMEEERYFLPKDNLYLVGSAEHTLGPLHMDQILEERDLPIRYVGFSSCFRREAGSYGKDVRGILRVHQFDKVEMECFTTPQDSLKEQDFLIAVQEYIMQSLGLPYQVVAICTGDMGGPDARQIDINTWMPAQNKYRETQTSDLMTDYQARRLNTRVRLKNGQTVFAHMNDATCIAVGRTLIAILENCQNADGSVTIPQVLVPYLGKAKITPRV